MRSIKIISPQLANFAKEEPKKLSKNSRLVQGGIRTLELPSHFTETDKKAFYRRRDERRGAVHVCEREDLTRTVLAHMEMKMFKVLNLI